MFKSLSGYEDRWNDSQGWPWVCLFVRWVWFSVAVQETSETLTLSDCGNPSSCISWIFQVSLILMWWFKCYRYACVCRGAPDSSSWYTHSRKLCHHRVCHAQPKRQQLISGKRRETIYWCRSTEVDPYLTVKDRLSWSLLLQTPSKLYTYRCQSLWILEPILLLVQMPLFYCSSVESLYVSSSWMTTEAGETGIVSRTSIILWMFGYMSAFSQIGTSFLLHRCVTPAPAQRLSLHQVKFFFLTAKLKAPLPALFFLR